MHYYTSDRNTKFSNEMRDTLVIGVDYFAWKFKRTYEICHQMVRSSPHTEEFSLCVKNNFLELQSELGNSLSMEDNIILSSDYVFASDHIRSHKELWWSVLSMIAAYDHGEWSLAEKVPELIIDKLNDHIVKHDIPYYRWTSNIHDTRLKHTP